MEAWIKPTAFGDFTTIFYKTDRYTREFLHLQTGNYDGHLHIGMNTDPYTWSTPNVVIRLNKWQHVAWTFDNAYQRLYVNGKKVFSVAFNQPFSGNQIDLRIGENTYIPASNFIGMIDEVRIYRKALTQKQIKRDMKKQIERDMKNI